MRLIEKAKYHYLLQKAVTTTYTKSNKETARRINCKGIKYTKEVNIPDNVQVNGTTNCFMTLTDHKRDSPSGGRVDWGGGENPEKLACLPMPPSALTKNTNFVIFMQFLATLPRLSPHQSTSFGKPCKRLTFKPLCSKTH